VKLQQVLIPLCTRVCQVLIPVLLCTKIAWDSKRRETSLAFAAVHRKVTYAA